MDLKGGDLPEHQTTTSPAYTCLCGFMPTCGGSPLGPGANCLKPGMKNSNQSGNYSCPSGGLHLVSDLKGGVEAKHQTGPPPALHLHYREFCRAIPAPETTSPRAIRLCARRATNATETTCSVLEPLRMGATPPAIPRNARGNGPHAIQSLRKVRAMHGKHLRELEPDQWRTAMSAM